MSALLSSVEPWMAIVGLLWLASVVVFVASMRRFFASRSLQRSSPETMALGGTFIDADHRAPSLPASDSTSVRDAIRARAARDPASAQGLKELIRALYLDQSNFTFSTIAELPTEDRALAKALIEEWLAAPSALQYWEELYAEIRDTPPPLVRGSVPNPSAEAKLG